MNDNIEHKYKVGDKVVPHNKTFRVGGPYNNSDQIIKMKEAGQEYLYVKGYIPVDGLILAFDNNEIDCRGDWFSMSDVTPYIEPSTEPPIKTTYRYEGLDPRIADLLKDHQLVHGWAWNRDIENPWPGSLRDYKSGLDSPFIVMVKFDTEDLPRMDMPMANFSLTDPRTPAKPDKPPLEVGMFGAFWNMDKDPIPGVLSNTYQVGPCPFLRSNSCWYEFFTPCDSIPTDLTGWPGDRTVYDKDDVK